MTTHIDPEALTGYLLGESANELSAVVARHLAECPDCRRREYALRRLTGVFANVSAPRPHAEVLDSLLAAQRRLRSARRRRALQGGLWTAGTIAAVMTVFAVGFWTGRRTSPDPRNSRPTTVVNEDADTPDAHDLAMPQVMFVAAIPDRVAGFATQDTTTN